MSKKTTSVEVKVGLVDRLTAPMRRVQSAMDRMIRPVKRLKRAFRELSEAAGLNRLGAAVGKLTGRVRRLAGAMTAVGAAAALATTKVVTSFASQGDAIAKMGRATGMNVETLQALRYAADRSGIDKATFDKSAMTFSKRLGEMKSGKGQMYSFLKDAAPELAKRLAAEADPTKAFEMAIASLSEIQDESKRAAAASAMFSRAGQRMALLGEAGPEAVAALKAEAFALGAVITAKDAANAETLTDAITNMTEAFKGLSNNIGAALAPVVTDLIGKFTKLMTANKELVRLWAENFAAKLPGMLQSAGAALTRIGDIFNKVKSVIETVIGPTTTVEMILGTLAALTLAPLATSVLSVSTALARVAIVLAANPIGLAILAIAGTAWVVKDNWAALVDWWQGAWQKIASAFETGWVKGVWEVWQQFNPLTLIIKSLDHLTEKWLGFSPVDIVNGWIADLVSLAGQFYETMAGLGAQMVQGLLDGLAAGWDALIGWLEAKMAGLRSMIDLGWLGDKLGLSSPEPVAAAGPVNDNTRSNVVATAERVRQVSPPAHNVSQSVDASVGAITVNVTPPPMAAPAAYGQAVGAAVQGRVKRQQGAAASLLDQ